MKRYKRISITRDSWLGVGMKEDDEGEWVKYKDIEYLLSVQPLPPFNTDCLINSSIGTSVYARPKKQNT